MQNLHDRITVLSRTNNCVRAYESKDYPRVKLVKENLC